MKTYYFDNSAWFYEKKVVVITENAFRKMQDNMTDGFDHHWIYGHFDNMEEARNSFFETWCGSGLAWVVYVVGDREFASKNYREAKDRADYLKKIGFQDVKVIREKMEV